MPKKLGFTIAFISWMALVTLFSLVSFSEGTLGTINIPHFDKLAHFVFYLVAALLCYAFLWEMAGESLSWVKALIMAVCFAIFYGIIIEVIQSELTRTRQGDFLDILANTLGALLAAVIIKIRFSGKRWLK
ncbi:MAG: VanZ family protein [Bacteroidota bacterium]